MKIVVCIPPSACDVYQHHSRYADEIARVGRARGITVDVLSATADDFIVRLFGYLADPDCIVHFHCFLYDLRISSVAFEKAGLHAVASARATTLATISDHPFTMFMQDMVRNASPTTRFITIDDTFIDEMRFFNPSLKTAHFTHTPLVPPINYEPACAVPYERRAYDFVLPIFLADMTGRGFDKVLANSPPSWLTRAGAAAYETMLHDLSRNPFHVFDDCIRRELGVGLREIGEHRPELAPHAIQMLNAVDAISRQVRRHRMISALLRSVGDLKVAIMGDAIPSLALDPRVSYLGRQSAPNAARLMGNSRAILNCNPTYPANIHERISVGMLYGACVISDVTPRITATFGPTELMPYAPGSTMTIQDIFAQHDVAAVAAAGQARVRAEPGFSWEAHFDRLLATARGSAAAAA